MAKHKFCTIALSLTVAALSGCSGDTTSAPNADASVSSNPTSYNSRATVTQESTTEGAGDSSSVGPSQQKPGTPAVVAKRRGRRRRKSIEMPQVFLSEQHAATCRVQVNDKMPDMSVVDADGNSKNLNSFLGNRVTVVCFWSPENPLSSWQLSDLGPEVVERYASQGVNVVAISHGQTTQESRLEADRIGVEFPVLADEGGQAYDQVATRYLPRTYLLDGEGNILWFDLGYSDDTRRHLNQAIRFALADDTLPRDTIRQ